MSMLLTVLLGFVAYRCGPQIVAGVVVTLTATCLVHFSRRSRRGLLGCAAATGPADWDARTNRAQRLALRLTLRTSLDLAVFTSLLPQQAARGYKLAAFIADLAHSGVADQSHGVARPR